MMASVVFRPLPVIRDDRLAGGGEGCGCGRGDQLAGPTATVSRPRRGFGRKHPSVSARRRYPPMIILYSRDIIGPIRRYRDCARPAVARRLVASAGCRSPWLRGDRASLDRAFFFGISPDDRLQAREIGVAGPAAMTPVQAPRDRDPVDPDQGARLVERLADLGEERALRPMQQQTRWAGRFQPS